MKKQVELFILFISLSSGVSAQFYTETPICEFEVDFSDISLGVLKYYGYRPTVGEVSDFLKPEFFLYFEYQIDPPETLISNSRKLNENNTAIDNRIKNAMRINDITLCETFYPNNYGGFTYIVNINVENYEKFNTISMDSTGFDEYNYLPIDSISNMPRFNDREIATALIYPPDALIAGIEGRVIVELFINKKGIVRQVRILREEPRDYDFGEAVVRLFVGRRCVPAMFNDKPVSSRYRYPVSFRINRR